MEFWAVFLAAGADLIAPTHLAALAVFAVVVFAFRRENKAVKGFSSSFISLYIGTSLLLFSGLGASLYFSSLYYILVRWFYFFLAVGFTGLATTVFYNWVVKAFNMNKSTVPFSAICVCPPRSVSLAAGAVAGVIFGIGGFVWPLDAAVIYSMGNMFVPGRQLIMLLLVLAYFLIKVIPFFAVAVLVKHEHLLSARKSLWAAITSAYYFSVGGGLMYSFTR